MASEAIELPALDATDEEKSLAASKVIAMFGNERSDIKRELINSEADLLSRERKLFEALALIADLRKRMATAAEAASRMAAPDGDAYTLGITAALEAVRACASGAVHLTAPYYTGCRDMKADCESAVSRLLGVGK